MRKRPPYVYLFSNPTGELLPMCVFVARCFRAKKVGSSECTHLWRQALDDLAKLVGQRIHHAQNFHPLIASHRSNRIQCRGIELPEDSVSRFATAE
jgi:hypothetical protein